MSQLKEYIANTLLRTILSLKKSKWPTNANQTIEFYLIDQDYDVKVTVNLASKKSQYQIGMEIFNGKSVG